MEEGRRNAFFGRDTTGERLFVFVFAFLIVSQISALALDHDHDQDRFVLNTPSRSWESDQNTRESSEKYQQINAIRENINRAMLSEKCRNHLRGRD